LILAQEALRILISLKEGKQIAADEVTGATLHAPWPLNLLRSQRKPSFEFARGSQFVRDPELPVEAGAEVAVDINRFICDSSMTATIGSQIRKLLEQQFRAQFYLSEIHEKRNFTYNLTFTHINLDPKWNDLHCQVYNSSATRLMHAQSK